MVQMMSEHIEEDKGTLSNQGTCKTAEVLQDIRDMVALDVVIINLNT